MVDNRRKGCRFSYLDNAIFQPSKIKLVLVTRRNHRYHYSGQVSVVFRKISTSLSPTCYTSRSMDPSSNGDPWTP